MVYSLAKCPTNDAEPELVPAPELEPELELELEAKAAATVDCSAPGDKLPGLYRPPDGSVTVIVTDTSPAEPARPRERTRPFNLILSLSLSLSWT